MTNFSSVSFCLKKICPVVVSPGLTSEAQLGFGVHQRLLDLLGLCDVHLEKRESGRTHLLQLPGALSIYVQYCGEHLKAQRVQTLDCGFSKPRVTAWRDRQDEEWDFRYTNTLFLQTESIYWCPIIYCCKDWYKVCYKMVQKHHCTVSVCGSSSWTVAGSPAQSLITQQNQQPVKGARLCCGASQFWSLWGKSVNPTGARHKHSGLALDHRTIGSMCPSCF